MLAMLSEAHFLLHRWLCSGNCGTARGVEEFLKEASRCGAVGTADAAAPFIPDDFRFSIANTPAKGAYTVASMTWLVVPIKDRAKLDAMKAFLRWMLGPGQSVAERVRFSKLPPSIVTQELQSLALLQ